MFYRDRHRLERIGNEYVMKIIWRLEFAGTFLDRNFPGGSRADENKVSLITDRAARDCGQRWRVYQPLKQ